MTWAMGVRLAMGAAAIGLMTGCRARALTSDGGGGGLGAIGGTGTGGAAGTPFQPTRDVDILVLVKNTSSTSLIQNNLLSNFPTFLTTLQNANGGLPSLHIAVITSDMGAGDGSIPGCNTTGGDGGRFQYTARGTCPSTGLVSGATYIIEDGGYQNFAGQAADVFACIARVGNNGCGFGQPLAAVARALGADGQPAPAENQGFLRPNAYLYIMVLMNQDDCSVPAGSGLFDTTSGTTLDSPLGPLADYRCNEFGHLCNGVKPPRRAPNNSANDVVMLDNCTSAEGAGMLTPVATLYAQLRSLKPFPDQQILVGVISGPSAPYTVYWYDRGTTDSGPWPEVKHSCDGTDGNFADPAVRLNLWAKYFGVNGQIFSVCDLSYAPALAAMANVIVPLIPAPVNMP